MAGEHDAFIARYHQVVDEPRTRQRDQLPSHFIDTAAYVYITNHTANAAAKG